MPEPAKEIQYAEIVKLFAQAFKQNRLYSEKHPAAQMAVQNFSAGLESILALEKDVTFGFLEGKVIVNDCPLDDKKIGVADLIRESQRLQMESLIFRRGIEPAELSSFFRILSGPPKNIEAMGGLSKVLEGEGFQFIRLGIARYRMIKEGEEIVNQSEKDAGETKEAGAALLPVRRMERMEDVLEQGLSGDERGVELDVDRLAYEVERAPENVAKEILRRAEDVESLKRLVELTARLLRDRLAEPFIQQGKDFSRPILKLAKELKRLIQTVQGPHDFQGSSEELVRVLEHSADAVKLDLIVRTFQDNGADVKALEKIKAKFLQGKETRERLLEPLKERLLSLGVSAEDFERTLLAEKARVSKKSDKVEVSVDELEELREIKKRYEKDLPQKSSKVEVSPEELEELRHIRDHFEEELARQLNHETGVLQNELRRTLDHKERVDNVIRSLAEGLVVVDNEGRIQMMNPAAERLLSSDQEVKKGTPLGESLKPEHIVALAKGPLLDETSGITKEIEVKSINDETRRILQASSAVIENEEGKTVGMVSVLSDITKQRRLDEMKSKFVAHVSHELRTPLVAIEQSLHLLLGKETGEITPEQEKFLSIAQRNISRLARLVNDLLDVAKLEAGQMKLNPIPFKICDMVHHVVETVRSWAENKEVAIEEKFPEADVEVEADPDNLIQVVTNLVGNAIKFTPERGQITLEVDPHYADETISKEPCVAIRVRDTGTGISPEDQEKIFKKFEQGSRPSPQGIAGSTGLGLTIAKEIVELHGGKIWVESKEGEGSLFAFVIPRRFRDGAELTPAPI